MRALTISNKSVEFFTDMETNLVILEKKAIDAALKNEWEKALEINKEILKKHPTDIHTKIRLGKAQIQTKNFKDAVATFKNVLIEDPINKIAKKNLEIAKEGKVSKIAIQPRKLIKEPGTTVETQVLTTKKLSLEIGQNLNLTVKKDIVEVYKDTTLIGTIEDKDIIKSLNTAKASKIVFEANAIKQRDNKIMIILTAETPIFKADKQDIKPYFKKGTIEDEEPELEFSTETVEEE